MFQQFASTRSSLRTSNLTEDVGLTVRPTMFFFLKSFLENKKDTGKGTQNEERGKVKTKKKPSRNVLDFLFSWPETPRIRRRCKLNSNPD